MNESDDAARLAETWPLCECGRPMPDGPLSGTVVYSRFHDPDKPGYHPPLARAVPAPAAPPFTSCGRNFVTIGGWGAECELPLDHDGPHMTQQEQPTAPAAPSQADADRDDRHQPGSNEPSEPSEGREALAVHGHETRFEDGVLKCSCGWYSRKLMWAIAAVDEEADRHKRSVQ